MWFEPPEHEPARDLRDADCDDLDTEPQGDDGEAAVGHGCVLVGEAPEHSDRQQRGGECEHDEGVGRGDPHVGPPDRHPFLGPKAESGDQGVDGSERSAGNDEVHPVEVSHAPSVGGELEGEGRGEDDHAIDRGVRR